MSYQSAACLAIFAVALLLTVCTLHPRIWLPYKTVVDLRVEPMLLGFDGGAYGFSRDWKMIDGFFNLISEKDHQVNMYLDRAGSDMSLVRSLSVQYSRDVKLMVSLPGFGYDAGRTDGKQGLLMYYNGESITTRRSVRMTRQLSPHVSVTYLASTTHKAHTEVVHIATPGMKFHVIRPNQARYLEVVVDCFSQHNSDMHGLLGQTAQPGVWNVTSSTTTVETSSQLHTLQGDYDEYEVSGPWSTDFLFNRFHHDSSVVDQPPLEGLMDQNKGATHRTHMQQGGLRDSVRVLGYAPVEEDCFPYGDCNEYSIFGEHHAAEEGSNAPVEYADDDDDTQAAGSDDGDDGDDDDGDEYAWYDEAAHYDDENQMMQSQIWEAMATAWHSVSRDSDFDEDEVADYDTDDNDDDDTDDDDDDDGPDIILPHIIFSEDPHPFNLGHVSRDGNDDADGEDDADVPNVSANIVLPLTSALSQGRKLLTVPHRKAIMQMSGPDAGIRAAERLLQSRPKSSGAGGNRGWRMRLGRRLVEGATSLMSDHVYGLGIGGIDKSIREAHKLRWTGRQLREKQKGHAAEPGQEVDVYRGGLLVRNAAQ